MVQWGKMFCLIAYGVLLGNVGLKIYEKYNQIEIVTPEVVQVQAPLEPAFWTKTTCCDQTCRVYIDDFENKNATLDDVVAEHEAFAHRHSNNETTHNECFLRTRSDEHKLINYTRNNTASDVVELTFLFEKREDAKRCCPNYAITFLFGKLERSKKCQQFVYKLTFRQLDNGVVSREVSVKCYKDPKLMTPKEIADANREFAWYEDESTKFSNPVKLLLILLCILFGMALVVAFVCIGVWCTEKFESGSKQKKLDKYQSPVNVTKTVAGVTVKAGPSTAATPEQNKANQSKSGKSAPEAPKTPEICEDDNISNSPEEIEMFTVPEIVEIQTDAESDTEEADKYASKETNVDQLNPVDMDMSEEEATFEHVN